MHFEHTGTILEGWLDYSLIGPLRALRNGTSLPLGGPKQRAVLAVLLLSHGRVVEFEKMIDAVWNGTPPVKAISSLRAYVANLRRILGDDAATLLTTSYGYRLDLGTGELDVDRFESLAARGRRDAAAGSHTRASTILGEALAYWTGAPLEDLRDLTFAVHEIHRLQELHADVVETYFDCRLAIGQHVDIVAPLEVQLLESPLRERLWSHLMLALYRSDRRADALHAFGRAATVLDEELGIAPGDALLALEAEIRAQSPSLQWNPPVDSTTPAPPQAHGLFGRNAELERISEAVSVVASGTGHIVMLGGEPGIGKTVIASEILARAEAGEVTTAWASPPAGMRQPPLWTWIQVLRRLGDTADRGQLARAAAALAPELLVSLPGWPSSDIELTRSSTVDRHAEFRLVDSVALALRRLVDGHPTMIVIDDLDRCDRATRDVLYVMAGNLQQLPLAVIAAFHDDGTAPRARRRSFDRLIGRSDTTLVRLRGLDLAATTDIVATIDPESSNGDLAAAIHEYTAGNPFYTREVARSLAASGGLPAGVVPDSVAAVIRRRTAKLPTKTRKAIRLAAAHALDLRVPHEAILDPAVGEGILMADEGSDQLIFCSPLIRDAVAAQCTRAELALARRTDATRLVRVASATNENLWQQMTN